MARGRDKNPHSGNRSSGSQMGWRIRKRKEQERRESWRKPKPDDEQ